MTSAVARTAAQALHNAAFPLIRSIADRGVEEALRELPALARGVYTHGGYMTRAIAADAAGMRTMTLHDALSRARIEALRG
jgi:alanine dehydrogenase